MAIQLQFRRGTTSENNVFIGAPGEVTMDVETNQIRIHDGEKLGGYIIGKPTVTNNLFDIKWTDHKLNDIRWLRADTFSWQSGDVYKSAYNHLLQEYTEKITTVDFSTSTPNVNLGDNKWNDIAYDGTKYVAISRTGYISTSTNRINWTAATQVANLSNHSWQCIAYNGTKFVALGDDGFGYVSTSTDGTTWSAATTNSDLEAKTWYGLIYDGTRFVALDSQGYIATSTDGTTWTAVEVLNLGNQNWHDLCYDGSKYVAISKLGYVSTSTDGSTWTAAVQNENLASVATLVSSPWARVVYDGIKFIAINSGGYVSTSIDGTTWSEPVLNTNLGSSAWWSSLCYVGTTVIALSSSGYISIAEVAEQETVAGITITYYTAEDGHKICSVNQANNVSSIYSATGVAWYYIIDIENNRFKLPRTKFAFTGLRDIVGNYVEAGAPNLRGYTGAAGDPGCDGVLFQNEFVGGRISSGQGYQYRSKFNASAYNSIYGNSDTIQPPATQMYLYFYVGEYTQTAIENTAGITSEELNNKVDKDDAVGYCSFNTATRIKITTTDQTAAKNGWLVGHIAFSGSNQNTVIYVNSVVVGLYGWSNGAQWFSASICLPIKAGQTYRFACSGTVENNQMYFYPND